MKKLLKYFEEPFKKELPLSKYKLLVKLTEGKEQTRGIADLISLSLVDHGDVKLLGEDKIEIKPKAGMFDPYKGGGSIVMTLESGAEVSETIGRGNIKPYNQSYIVAFYGLLTFLLLWTIVAFVTDISFNTILLVVAGWVLFPLFMLLPIIWTRNRLRDYRDSFLNNIK